MTKINVIDIKIQLLFGVVTFKASSSIKRENKTGLQAANSPLFHPKRTINVVSHLRSTSNPNFNAVVHAFNAMIQFSIDSIFQKNRPKQFSVYKIKRFLKSL